MTCSWQVISNCCEEQGKISHSAGKRASKQHPSCPLAPVSKTRMALTPVTVGLVDLCQTGWDGLLASQCQWWDHSIAGRLHLVADNNRYTYIQNQPLQITPQNHAPNREGSTVGFYSFPTAGLLP